VNLAAECSACQCLMVGLMIELMVGVMIGVMIG
jgi:hypothetical protein